MIKRLTYFSVCLITTLLISSFYSIICAKENEYIGEESLIVKPLKETSTYNGTDKSIEWSLNDNGLLTITGTGNMPNYSYPYAPWYQYRDSIKSIVIEDTITSIGDQAFISCTNLVSIDFGNSITSIGEGAFYGCSSIETIFIPNTVAPIGNGAFCECGNLTHIVLPNTITYIGEEAFENCTNITAYVYDNSYSKTYCINNSINYIEIETDFVLDGITITPPTKLEYEYDEDLDLTGLEVYGMYESDIHSVPIRVYGGYSIDGYNKTQGGSQIVTVSYMTYTDFFNVNVSHGTVLYFGTDQNINWTIYQDGTLLVEGDGDMPNWSTYKNDRSPWYQYNETINDVVLSNSITSIGVCAFRYCTNLTSIAIPNSVIRLSGFNYCTSLTSLMIPNSVVYITSDAFRHSGLTSITIPDSVTSIGNRAFQSTVLTSITIPDSVTSIGSYAFSGCSSLTSITIPDSVTSIGSYAFRNCSSLTSIIIPDSVASIGQGAFSGCSNLSSINIPESIISINSSTFSGCSSLTSITIPDSVTSIGSGAFENCSSLSSINISEGITSIGDSSFKDCSSLSSITIPDSITLIGNSAFMNCTSLCILTMPISTIFENNHWFEGVTNLTSVTLTKGTGTGANFDNWTIKYTPWYTSKDSLTSITLENGITSIGNYAFYDCSNVSSINIPNSVTSIGPYAFKNCSSLTSITIPDSVTSIGSDAFNGCSNLSSINIPESITSINNRTFSGCSSLTSITIPDLVASIGNSAFNGCSSLTSITIPDSVATIKDNAFYGCSGLTSLTMPISATIEKINCFSGVSNLVSITLTKGTGIGEDHNQMGESFYPWHKTPWYLSRSNLETIVLEEGIISIGHSTFRDYSGATSITIPNSVTSIGDYAFADCDENLTLCAFEHSYLQQYCQDNNLTYQELSKISNKTMSGTLKNNGTVSLTLNVEVDDGTDLDNAYALINGKKVSLDSIDTNGRVSLTTPGVAPKSINDDFVIRYYDGNDNPISKEINLSVKDYIETLLNGYLNKKTKTFYKSLLNYASYAQEYFDYNTDNLANESLDELDKDVSDVTHDDLTAYSASKAGLTEGISAYGQTLVLNNEVDYRIYFLLDGSHSIDEYIFKDGNNTLNKFKYSNSLYYVIIPKMAAPDLDKSHTVTVTLNGEGNLSITSSVLTYVEITLKDEPISQKDIQLANLMKALYKYSISAKNLLGA